MRQVFAMKSSFLLLIAALTAAVALLSLVSALPAVATGNDIQLPVESAAELTGPF